MEELINRIELTLKDYRKDEGCSIDYHRIKNWVGQFNSGDHEFLLRELNSILEKRYFSKEKVIHFLRGLIKKITADFGYQHVVEMLENSVFLNLQNEDKSQTILLSLLKDILLGEFNFDINNCGSSSRTNLIYIDDILCTGNTLYQNLYDFFNSEKNAHDLELLKKNKIKLISAFICLHLEHYNKTRRRLNYQLKFDFSSRMKCYKWIDVQNTFENNSRLDYLLPIYSASETAIIKYQQHIEEQVNAYCHSFKYDPPKPHFYRDIGLPKEETLFSTQGNRTRFENIILKKGIEILSIANVNKHNVRSLGYDLPSHKNFGFGTLVFTYRNIPNNTPLVFWYAGGGFSPLFQKNPTSQQKIVSDSWDQHLEDLIA